MISCKFPDGKDVELRHLVTNVIVIKNGKILLAKRAGHLIEAGKWTLPGGYMNRDELVIEAAKRELLEETGWEAKNLKLFRISDNPNKPDGNNQNVNLIFIGEPIKQSGSPDNEVDDLEWFPLNQLPKSQQIAFDHEEDIELYKKYLKEKFELPVIG